MLGLKDELHLALIVLVVSSCSTTDEQDAVPLPRWDDELQNVDADEIFDEDSVVLPPLMEVLEVLEEEDASNDVADEGLEVV